MCTVCTYVRVTVHSKSTSGFEEQPNEDLLLRNRANLQRAVGRRTNQEHGVLYTQKPQV